MNNEEKDLKNVEVANETEKNARFGRKNKQKAEGEKTQEEKTVKKVNHIGLYENRELSWLKFNERVLEEAEDTSVPLCERMTFLSIFQSNLDEFFMVRVGSLEDQKLLSQKLRENKTNMTAGEQIEAILKRVAELNERKDAIYASIMKEVGEKGVHLTDFKALAKSESKYLEEYFMKEIVPLLSVMIVGRKQPFPFLKGQEIYALAVLGTRNGKKKIGIIPCSSSVFPRLIRIPTKDDTYMLVEELILHFLPKVYKGYKVLEKSVIRVTRNADIDFNAVYALIIRKTLFKGEAVPFVMELPNYRMPALKNVLQLLWEKAKDFLQRAFTVIVVATIVIWFLQSFDLHFNLTADSQNSILAVVAGLIAPVFAPLGFGDWRISTALISGFMAKESVVSTLSVLTGSMDVIHKILTPASALSLLIFCLLYTPCVAAVSSVKRELGSKWALVVVVGQCVVAWIMAALVYAICLCF